MSRTYRLLAMLVLCLALATTTSAVAAQPTPPTIEDQHDRRLRQLEAEQAARTQAAVELFRSGERNFVPDPDIIGRPGGQPRRSTLSPVLPSKGRMPAARREPALDPLPAENADFWRAVRALPQRQAQAVALYYLGDLSIQQTAVVLDCAEGTVRAHLAKARRTLARRLRLDTGEAP